MNTKIIIFFILSFCFLSGNCIFGNTTDELGPSYDSQKLEVGPLTVPACCPTENYNDTEGSCKPTNMTSSFSPPILFRSGKRAVQYEITTVMNTISCNDNEDKIEVLIDSSKENDSLLYDSDAVFLISKSDPRIIEISQLENFVIVPPSDYCITNIAGDYLGVYCIPNYAHRHDMYCEDHICYPKCCPEGEIVDIYNMTCIIPEDDVDMCSPEFFSISSINKFSQRINYIDNFNKSQFITGEQPCIEINSTKPSDPIFVLDSGHLHHANTTKEYCIDNFTNSSIINGLLRCKMACKKNYLLLAISNSSAIMSLLMLCLFCVITRELREKMHGKILIGYFVSLILTYITILSILLTSRQNTTTEIEIRVLSKF